MTPRPASSSGRGDLGAFPPRSASGRTSSSGAGELGAWSSGSTPSCDGEALGWAEAPQGEVLYLVAVEDGRLRRVEASLGVVPQPRAVHSGVPKDIMTDFAFIEASFGLSIAGVAG